MSFLHTSSESVLCDQWIRGDNLCVAIINLLILNKDKFIIRTLTKVLNIKEGKVIKNQIDNSPSSAVMPDHIGIFHQMNHPPKRKMVNKKVIHTIFILCHRKEVYLLRIVTHVIIPLSALWIWQGPFTVGTSH